MSLKDLFGGFLKKGVKISYSTGKPLDPADVEQTDAMEDITKHKEERDGKSKVGSKSVE